MLSYVRKSQYILKNENKNENKLELNNSITQKSKYFLKLKELEENIKYIYQLLNMSNHEQKTYLETNLKELMQQKSKLKRLIIKEEHNKLIKEMNMKIEKEIKKKNNISNSLNNIVYQNNNKISVNNVEIPEGTHTWRNQKLPENESLFTDDLFLPSKKNLCELKKSGEWELPENVDEIDLYGWESIKWERVENIFMSSDYQVFYDEIEKEDIIQGNLGNCYFLSAISSLCKYPKLIEKLFFFKEKSDEHCYGCYFRINGIWKLVLLDDFIPCYKDSFGNNFSFSHTNGNELWVILLEKAWAKLNGNYARIIGGDPHEIFEVLTNAYCEKFMFNNLTKEEIWDKFKNAQEKGFLMTAGTNSDEELPIEEMGLVSGHAYSVIKVIEVVTEEGKEKLVNLRNPWGHKEWCGDWSDESNKWTKDIRKQCNNYDIKNDGSFWMSFDDFHNFFIIGGICHLYENYKYSFFHIFKQSAEKGAFLSKIIINQNNTHCFLMGHQKNPRVILRDGQYQKPVLFYLMLVDSNFEYISSTYGQEQNITIDIVLNKGIYYRYAQKEQHGYTLSCYSSSSVKILYEQNQNIEKVFKQSLYSYSKLNIIPKKNKGGLIYKIKKKNKHFPFSFFLFDNSKGNTEIIISDLIFKKENKNVTFYFEGEKNSNEFIEKEIFPGGWDIFCLMPYKLGDSYSTQIKTISKENNISIFYKQSNIPFLEEKNLKDNYNLFENIFKEDFQVLDDEGLIRQFIYINKKYYYLGLENISENNAIISMKFEYKIEKDKINTNIIDINIKSKSRKAFSLNYNDSFIGEISFDFKVNY